MKKEEEEKKMSIKKLLLIEKMKEICQQCNRDIKDIRLYLKYKYDPEKNDLSRIMRDFKSIVTEFCKSHSDMDLVKDFIVKLGGCFSGN